MSKAGCPDCAAARAERDEALLQLAKARELLEAQRMAMAARGEEAPPNYPDSQPPGPPPWRYVWADAANDLLKRRLTPLHKVLKAAAGRLRNGS